MKKLAILITLLLTVGTVNLADAAVKRGFKDGPFIARPQGGDVQEEDTGFGWAAAYEFNHISSLDVSLSRITDTLGGDTLGAIGFPSDASLDLQVYALAITGRAGIDIATWVRLYAGGGFGYYWVISDAQYVRGALAGSSTAGPRGHNVFNADIDVEKDFGYHAAAGIEFLLTPDWEIILEYRKAWFESSMVVEVDEQEGEIGGTGTIYSTRDTKDFTYDHGMIRLGLNYRF